MQATVAATDHLFHRTEVIVTDETFNFKAAVIFAIRRAVLKRDHRGHAKTTRDVGDVETLHAARFLGNVELFF